MTDDTAAGEHGKAMSEQKTDEELKAEFLANHGATKLPTQPPKDYDKAKREIGEFLARGYGHRTLSRRHGSRAAKCMAGRNETQNDYNGEIDRGRTECVGPCEVKVAGGKEGR